jgi:hypothetical protein
MAEPSMAVRRRVAPAAAPRFRTCCRGKSAPPPAAPPRSGHAVAAGCAPAAHPVPSLRSGRCQVVLSWLLIRDCSEMLRCVPDEHARERGAPLCGAAAWAMPRRPDSPRRLKMQHAAFSATSTEGAATAASSDLRARAPLKHSAQLQPQACGWSRSRHASGRAPDAAVPLPDCRCSRRRVAAQACALQVPALWRALEAWEAWRHGVT